MGWLPWLLGGSSRSLTRDALGARVSRNRAASISSDLAIAPVISEKFVGSEEKDDGVQRKYMHLGALRRICFYPVSE